MARHMTYDVQVSNPECLVDKRLLTWFMLNMVEAAKMKILAGPYVIEAGARNPNPGLTGWTVLSTSHVSVHTFTRQQRVFIDLFSCVEYDPVPVHKIVARTFAPATIKSMEVHRDPMEMYEEE